LLSLILIIGPTASGKSKLALKLAERIDAEIISADSVQVYKFMDIGTAKPSLEERSRIPHHLIDIIYPDEPFDAAQFKKEAEEAISRISKKGKRIIVVGGSGLYIKALTFGLFPCPDPRPEIRKRYEEEAKIYGVEYLHKRLKKIDPKSFSRLSPKDKPRIIRALEVFEQTGIPISEHQARHGFKEKRYKWLKFGILHSKEELNQRIEARVNSMIQRGFVEEVRGLLQRGYSPSLKSLQVIGYKQIISYLKGEICLDKAIFQIKQQTKHYAKRQRTWFKKDPEIKWIRNLEEVLTQLSKPQRLNQPL
jgi:tRNA dimethylallyltransferase